MKDYRLEIKVKNGLLWRAMQDFGHKNVPELARACGLGLATVYKFMNLKLPPINSIGKLKPGAEILCLYFGVGVEELFPSEVLYVGIEKNLVERWADCGECLELSGPPPTPDELISASDQKTVVRAALDGLSARERRVIEMRYGIHGHGGRTLEETADAFHVTRERVRQIETKAIRKLREPQRRLRAELL